MRITALAGWLALACHGGGGDRGNGTESEGAQEGGSAADSGDEGADELDCDAPRPGESPIRRLTRRELDNTLADLLGEDAAVAGLVLPTDVQPHIFDTDIESHGITEELALAYLRTAEQAAAATDVESLVACDPATGEACARTFVASFCDRARRRPCPAAHVDELVAVWATGDDFDDGVRRVIEVGLQSADFLYRPEIGVTDGSVQPVVPLDGWEIASRLSYLLWGTMPDDELFAAAASDALLQGEGIAAQAERMLADPRARQQVVWFNEQWLGWHAIDTTSKDPVQFAGFEGMRPRMREEAARFVESVVLGGGDLSDLLTATHTFVDGELAAFYGIATTEGGAFGEVELAADRHAGILTKGALLAVGGTQTSSSPTRRGLAVVRQLLCAQPPLPPPGVTGSIPPPTPDTTTRERYEVHVADPSCAGCHVAFDPIGFAFEHFDAAGRWRDREDGFAIDASGELVGTDVDGTFDGAPELAAALAESEQVQHCYAERLFEFASGRPPDPDADACTIDGLRQAFADADHRMMALTLALVQSDWFRYRGP